MKTLFIKLPIDYQKVISCGCDCRICKERKSTPMWDTLAIDINDNNMPQGNSCIVHFPELKNSIIK